MVEINNKIDIWPLIIVNDRYGGIYSGGEWIAWHCYIDHLPRDQAGGDCECWDFWNSYDGFPACGKGKTIDEALQDLKKNLEERERKTIDE